MCTPTPSRPHRTRRAAAPRSSQRGFALLLVLLLSVISLAIGLYAALGARTETSLAHNDLLVKQAWHAAEAGAYHAARVISNRSNADDELASNSGGTCTAAGLGNGPSGLATIGQTAQLNGVCYRFREFGPDTGDGYYVVVTDNRDEGAAANDPLSDKDQTIRVTSVGVVGTAIRTIRMTLTAPSVFGFFSLDEIRLTGGSYIDSYVTPYSAGTATRQAKVGSNGDIRLNGSTTNIGGNAFAGGTVSTGTGSVSGTITNGADPQTFPPVPRCSPYSNNAGISPASAYNSTTGRLSISGSVTLAPGTYCFDDVIGGGTLNTSGPTILNITGRFDAGVANSARDAYDLQVNINGGGDVRITGGGEAYMVLYAPDSDVDVHGHGDYFGTIIAKTINATGGSGLHQQLNSSILWKMSGGHEIR